MGPYDLPTQAESSQVLEVDEYPDRLRLLDAMSAAYPAPPGYLDPMEGDRIQTAWQLSSGRGANPWWNRINYTLTVWRMLALKSRGEFADIEVRGREQARLPDPVRVELVRYYDAVRRHEGLTERGLQRLFWRVHELTLQYALEGATDLVSTLPPGEREFALGWGRVMVQALADANFGTDEDFIACLNAQCLPQRLCGSADVDPLAPSDLPPAQRATVLMITSLARYDGFRPLYAPVLASGAGALNASIAVEVEVRRRLSDLRGHLHLPRPDPR